MREKGAGAPAGGGFGRCGTRTHTPTKPSCVSELFLRIRGHGEKGAESQSKSCRMLRRPLDYFGDRAEKFLAPLLLLFISRRSHEQYNTISHRHNGNFRSRNSKRIWHSRHVQVIFFCVHPQRDRSAFLDFALGQTAFCACKVWRECRAAFCHSDGKMDNDTYLLSDLQ